MSKRQFLYIWIAMLTILFSALAPTVSHALASTSTSVATMEICTVDGYKLVQLLDADSGKVPAPTKHGMEHCAFCSTHGGSHALTASPSVTLALDGSGDLYPSLFYAALYSLHVWTAANPRGPPFFV